MKKPKTNLQATPGDVVVVHGHTTGDAGRTGVILEVLDAASGHEHYRVRWDEEHETLFSGRARMPASGRRLAVVVAQATTRARTRFPRPPARRLGSTGVGRGDGSETVVRAAGSVTRTMVPASGEVSTSISPRRTRPVRACRSSRSLTSRRPRRSRAVVTHDDDDPAVPFRDVHVRAGGFRMPNALESASWTTR